MGLVLLALFAPTTQAAPRKVIEKPDWAVKPTNEDMERFFPKRAQAEGVSGKAVITCIVTAAGSLDRCEVTDEAPKGYGFGDAALAMAPTFRMSPERVDGKAVEGAQVTLPLVFSVPSGKSRLGDPAMRLTRVGSDGPVQPEAQIIPCPDGQSDCEVHYVIWITQPDAKETARIVAPVTLDTDMTFAACVAADNGLLKDCQLGGDVTPVTRAAVLAAIKGLRAEPKTVDGLPTASETVFVQFRWDWLKLGSKEAIRRTAQPAVQDEADTTQ